MEESTPQDTDVRREAETIRQVREREDTGDHDRGSISAAASSPNLMPTVPGPENALEDIPEDSTMGLESSQNGKGMMMAFGRQASRNSGGVDYWNRFDKDTRTPPPPPVFGPRGSSSMSVDMTMDSPGDSAARSGSVASTLEPPAEDMVPSSSSAGLPKKFGKRSREDDFDIASIKRRAVSPSLSVHNSPIVAHSPRDRESMSWGQPPKTTRENSGAGTVEPSRSNSGGSVSSAQTAGPSGGPKRIGLQGMTDTHDGLMKMSIE